jgi:uncharacterized membrane protein HdeD (DUF308 family)
MIASVWPGRPNPANREHRFRGTLDAALALQKLEGIMTNGGHANQILLTTLGQNWWMLGARGLLAGLFGLAVLFRPGLSLNLLIATFGVYAVLDGAWAVASALWVSRISFAMWPVLFEGAVSLAVGGLALGWPLVPRDAICAIAVWGLLTGVLELVAAARLPRRSAGAWLLLTGGVFSLFLAVLILVLPHAAEPSVARAVGVYALCFGGLLLAAAVSLRTVLRTS